MATDLEKIARKIDTLEKEVARLKTRERPSYASGFLSDMTLYPHLLGLWPFSSIDHGNVVDISGQNRTLFQAGSPSCGVISDRFHFLTFNGSNQYLTRPTIYATSNITVGGWFYLNDFHNAGLIGQYGCENGFMLSYDEINQAFVFTISSNGTNSMYAISTETILLDTWYFIVGRFVPSTSVDLYVNENKYSNITAVYASLNDTGASFRIGVFDSGFYYLSGRVGLSFMYGYSLTDGQIGYIYQKTKVMFNP